MTTPMQPGPQMPTQPGPPPYPPVGLGHPAPPPPPPPPPTRRRRKALVVAVSALVLVLAAGAAGAWWLTRDEDGSALAGRPRVTDRASGISYAIPEGWKRSDKGDLIDAFTSSIARQGKGDEGAVLAGKAGPPAESASELRLQAERAARSNAEFFFPDSRPSLDESRAVKVSGRPAHTVALDVRDQDGRSARLRFTLVSVDDERSAFLLGIGMAAREGKQPEADLVLESASLE